MTHDIAAAAYWQDQQDVLETVDDMVRDLPEPYRASHDAELMVDRAAPGVDVAPDDDGVELAWHYDAGSEDRRATFTAGVYDAEMGSDRKRPRRDLVLRYHAGDPVLFDRIVDAAADVIDTESTAGDRSYRFSFPRAVEAAPR